MRASGGAGGYSPLYSYHRTVQLCRNNFNVNNNNNNDKLSFTRRRAEAPFYISGVAAFTFARLGSRILSQHLSH